MPEVFNPNPGAMPDDYQTQLANILRQRKIAEMLRKQADQGQPQGQMISGRFVKPHWSQNLAPLLNQVTAGQAENQANAGEADYNKRINEATRQWENTPPQAIPAQPEMAGPVDPSTGSPELAAKAAQPVTTGQRLKYALAGSRIPGNEKAADTWLKAMQAEDTREDNQTFKREESLANRIADLKKHSESLAQKAAEIKLRHEDARFSVEERVAMAREARALQREKIKADDERARLQMQVQSTHWFNQDATQRALAEEKLGGGKGKNSAEETRLLLNDATTLAEKATSSGIGNVLDRAAEIIGYSPEGSIEANNLKILGGKLMLANDRLEGQQSNEDRRLYETMVGRIMDPSLPRAAKLAAIEKLHDLNERRAAEQSNRKNALPALVQPPSALPMATAPAAAPTQSKTIGGKTYVKRDGKWWPQ